MAGTMFPSPTIYIRKHTNYLHIFKNILMLKLHTITYNEIEGGVLLPFLKVNGLTFFKTQGRGYENT